MSAIPLMGPRIGKSTIKKIKNVTVAESSAAESIAAESSAEMNECGQYDTQFLRDIKASLKKAEERTQCKYDCKGKQCYQSNRRHTAAFSHKYNCNYEDIKFFKPDADIFLKNGNNIYTCYNNFSLKWHIEIGARRGAEKLQIYTAIYNQYDTLIFYILANVTLHLSEYISLYGKAFLLQVFQSFESNDNTGLFPITDKKSNLGQIFTKYAPKEVTTQKIDYRLGNTTISGIIKNPEIEDKEGEPPLNYIEGEIELYNREGGGKRKKKTMKKNRKKNKKTHKRKHYIKRK